MSLATYEVIVAKAKKGDKEAQLHLALIQENPDTEKINHLKKSLTKEEISHVTKQVKADKQAVVVEKDLSDLGVSVVKETVSYIPIVGTSMALYEGIQNGTIVGTVVEEVVLKKLKVAERIAQAGGKVVKIADKFYATINGKIKNVTDSVKGYKLDTMRPGHIGGNSNKIKQEFKKGNDGKIFVKDSYVASKKGTGNNYTVFKRSDIDLDKKFIHPRTKKVTTNRELMQEGQSPYVLKNGKWQQIQLHHSRQNPQGPLFEVRDGVHRAKTNRGGEALHPYKTKRGRELNGEGGGESGKLHPDNPVDRNKFNKDREQYWKDRLKDFKKKEN